MALDAREQIAMELSDEEVVLAEKYIAQFETVTRMVQWIRWIVLAVSISLLSSVVYLYGKGVEVQEMNTAESILKGSDLPEGGVRNYTDVRIELLRIEGMINIKMIFSTLFGGVALGYFIASWGQEIRRKLIAKSLRVLLTNISQQNASNN